MNRRPTLRLLGVALGLALCAPAFAADPTAPADPTGVSSDIERTASTSPSEKLAYAASANQEISDAEKDIARLLELARKDGDQDAIECLVSRLTSVRALLQVSIAAEIALQDKLAAGEEELANQQFRRIATALSKTRVLLAEAQRCASNQQLDSGNTLVDWESALGDGDGDTTITIDTLTMTLEPPQVSPFF